MPIRAVEAGSDAAGTWRLVVHQSVHLPVQLSLLNQCTLKKATGGAANTIG
jgi:hypothetical protein